jgi:hypothetical protein
MDLTTIRLTMPMLQRPHEGRLPSGVLLRTLQRLLRLRQPPSEPCSLRIESGEPTPLHCWTQRLALQPDCDQRVTQRR